MVEVLPVRGDDPDPEVVARAAGILRRGALLIYPTETLYAIGGRADSAGAARAVRRLKGRDDGKPLPVVAADEAQARTLAADWPEDALRLARRFWPGPLTLVLPAAAPVPEEVTAGRGTVAVRVSGLALARALCRAAGPLVSTSANQAGAPPPIRCPEAVAQVGKGAALALDAGPGGGAPSTIVDLCGPRPALLREGAVPWTEVRRVLGDASR